MGTSIGANTTQPGDTAEQSIAIRLFGARDIGLGLLLRDSTAAVVARALRELDVVVSQEKQEADEGWKRSELSSTLSTSSPRTLLCSLSRDLADRFRSGMGFIEGNLSAEVATAVAGVAAVTGGPTPFLFPRIDRVLTPLLSLPSRAALHSQPRLILFRNPNLIVAHNLLLKPTQLILLQPPTRPLSRAAQQNVRTRSSTLSRTPSRTRSSLRLLRFGTRRATANLCTARFEQLRPGDERLVSFVSSRLAGRGRRDGGHRRRALSARNSSIDETSAGRSPPVPSNLRVQTRFTSLVLDKGLLVCPLSPFRLFRSALPSRRPRRRRRWHTSNRRRFPAPFPSFFLRMSLMVSQSR